MQRLGNTARMPRVEEHSHTTNSLNLYKQPPRHRWIATRYQLCPHPTSYTKTILKAKRQHQQAQKWNHKCSWRGGGRGSCSVLEPQVGRNSGQQTYCFPEHWNTANSQWCAYSVEILARILFGSFAKNEAKLILAAFYLVVAESMQSSLLWWIIVILSTTFVWVLGLFYHYTFHFFAHTLEFYICRRQDLWQTNRRATSLK